MDAVEWISSAVSEFVGLFSVSRAFYSALVILVIVLLAKSLVSTWRTGKITVGTFDYFADGAKKDEFGQQIRAETFEFYNLIVRLIQEEAKLSEYLEENPQDKEKRESSDRLPAIRSDQIAALSGKSGELQQLEITVQGINIKNIFTAASDLISPRPREVRAAIFSSNSSRRVFVTAPLVEGRRRQERPVPSLISGGAESDTATAFRIACYMIWSQWEKAATDGFGVNFSEFCRVARLLYIRNTFDSIPSYEFQKAKFRDDVDFLKEVFQTAALARPKYDLIYSSLGGLQQYVGDETIDLTSTSKATIDSVVDLIGIFSRQSTFGRRRGNDWTKTLPPIITERKVVDRQFFQERMLEECDAKGVPNAVKSQFANVVRIVSDSGERLPGVRTGLIVADEAVVTVGLLQKDELETLPSNTRIEMVHCGKVVETYGMGTAVPISPSETTHIKLHVPGLKLGTAAPVINQDEDVSETDHLFVVGHLQHADLLFRNYEERVPRTIDNHMLRIFLGQKIRKWTSLDLEGEGWFDLDVPFGAGMLGSPIFSGEGALVGFIGAGQRLSRAGSVSLSVAAPAGPLAKAGPAQH
jgi:hypothetical protein